MKTDIKKIWPIPLFLSEHKQCILSHYLTLGELVPGELVPGDFVPGELVPSGELVPGELIPKGYNRRTRPLML
jgi:hypothetical protein